MLLSFLGVLSCGTVELVASIQESSGSDAYPEVFSFVWSVFSLVMTSMWWCNVRLKRSKLVESNTLGAIVSEFRVPVYWSRLCVNAVEPIVFISQGETERINLLTENRPDCRINLLTGRRWIEYILVMKSVTYGNRLKLCCEFLRANL